VDAFRYAIVRYVPDPVREEQINVGVVVARDDPPYFGARFLRTTQTGRLKRLGPTSDFRFIRELAAEMSASEGARLIGGPWDLAALEAAVSEWANTIQFSTLRTALHERPDLLIDTLYARYVADPRPPRKRARDRRWIRQRLRTGLRQRLVELRPEVLPADVIRTGTPIEGEFESHTFDFSLANGEIRRLVQTLSFEGVDRGALKTEVEALAWVIDDVRRNQIALPISVVTVGQGSLLDSAERIYRGLDAGLVREGDIEAWVDTAVVDLAASLA
jgi:hypothetical protein